MIYGLRYETEERAASGSRNCKPKKRVAMASRRRGRAANVATNRGNRFHAKKYVGNVERIFFLRSSVAEIMDSEETVSQPSPRTCCALEVDYHITNSAPLTECELFRCQDP